MEHAGLSKVLCVDDEPEVLNGLKLNLRRYFQITTAPSGAAGLAAIKKEGPFAVVLSDMRMPAMEGTGFLSRVRETAPETVRILLTGQADVNAAIEAVNEGQVFRFLTKPCPIKQLIRAIQAGVQQHKLQTSEKVLLEQTLSGSIKTLMEILSIVSPAAFGRAIRLKRYVGKLAEAMGARNRWQIEVAATLSQLGCVTLPPETAEKLYHGRELDQDEERMTRSLAEFGARILGNIPRLEEVREIMRYQNRLFDSPSPDGHGPSREQIPLGARLLKIALDYDVLEARETPEEERIAELRSRAGWYDPKGLDILESLIDEMTIAGQVKKVMVDELCPGTIVAADMMSRKGSLLIARGNKITEEALARLENYGPGTVREPIRILIPDPEAS